MKVFFLSLVFVAQGFSFTVTSYVDPWDTGDLEILVNTSGCTANILPAVQAAVDLWNSAPFSGLTLKFRESTAVTASGLLAAGVNYPNTAGIACQTATGSPFDDGFTGGVGSYRNSGGVRQGSVVLNAVGSYSYGIHNYTAKALEILVTHEIGHMLNIGHSQLQEAIMYYNVGGKTELSLSADDMNAMAYLYPRNEFFDEGLMGCGLINSNSGKLPKPLYSAIFLFFLGLPFLLLFKLKKVGMRLL